MLRANNSMYIPRLLAFCLVLLALTGCATSTIVLNGTYPAPLVRKIPLTLGVYYPPELRNYAFTETDAETGDKQYLLQIGASQLKLFNTLLPALFDKVVLLDSVQPMPGTGAIDAVFIPAIAEFQLGLPHKTRMQVYEIWMKYDLKLSKTNGEQIADWVMTAYGKAPQESLQLVDSGVQNAAMVAMRDLAASLTLGFAEVPAVKAWLQAGHRNAVTQGYGE